MSSTKSESKWRMKHSLIFILSFIPVLNCVPFFKMYADTKNKRWNIIAIVLLFVEVILLSISALLPALEGPEYPNYDSVENLIDVKDYMNSEQRLKYARDYSYDLSEEWKSSNEYYNYIKANDERRKREQEWKKQPEIADQIQRYDTFRGNIDAITGGMKATIGFICVFAVCFAFIERSNYLKILKQRENSDTITQRMQFVNQNVAPPTSKPISRPIPQTTTNIDINNASEEEIASLQGLTILDAKKAITYREEHNGFKTVDEFFECINAKPHIVVALQEKIFISDNTSSKSQSSDSVGKRTIDI